MIKVKSLFLKIIKKISYLYSRRRELIYSFNLENYIYRDDVNKIKTFKNKHSGDRCFIIGNGKSLNLLDLTKLKNEITFGVNAIYLNKDKMGFLPTYYFVEDIFVAEDRKDEINNLSGALKFFGHYLKYCIKKDENTVFLNVKREFNERNPNFPDFSTDASKKLFVGGTVSYLNLQLAYYMGFRQVILIGFDHHYIIPNDAKVTFLGRDILSTNDDPNHFASDYFGKGKRWHDPRVDNMERAYKKAKIFYDNDNREILNATPDSKLNVFKKIDYNSLF